MVITEHQKPNEQWLLKLTPILLVGNTAAGEPATLPHRNTVMGGHASAVMQVKMGASGLIQFKPI